MCNRCNKCRRCSCKTNCNVTYKCNCNKATTKVIVKQDIIINNSAVIPQLIVPFENLTNDSGVATINMSNYTILENNPRIEVWTVELGQFGAPDTEKISLGVGITKTKVDTRLTQITVDGLFGKGYILISK